MKILLQRVKSASVKINNELKGEIDHGMLVFLGITHDDNQDDIEWLCRKLSNLRIFPDVGGIMNLSIKEAEGSFLVISQFTLHASTKKGNRPSYIRAARPEQAIPLYEQFINRLRIESGLVVQSGEFGADMKVALINDGPVTIMIDSEIKE